MYRTYTKDIRDQSVVSSNNDWVLDRTQDHCIGAADWMISSWTAWLIDCVIRRNESMIGLVDIDLQGYKVTCVNH
jgi:hypothetical protein